MCAAVIAIELFAPLLIRRPPAPPRRFRPARRPAGGIALTATTPGSTCSAAALCVFMLDDAILGYSPQPRRHGVAPHEQRRIAAARHATRVRGAPSPGQLGVRPAPSPPVGGPDARRRAIPHRQPLRAVRDHDDDRDEIIVEKGSNDGAVATTSSRTSPAIPIGARLGRAASAAARLADVVRRAGRR